MLGFLCIQSVTHACHRERSTCNIFSVRTMWGARLQKVCVQGLHVECVTCEFKVELILFPSRFSAIDGYLDLSILPKPDLSISLTEECLQQPNNRRFKQPSQDRRQTRKNNLQECEPVPMVIESNAAKRMISRYTTQRPERGSRRENNT